MNNRIEILPGVHLTAVQTEKFKTGCFSINFLRPLSHDEATANALIPSILLRGSEKYPDIRSITAGLDELYGASMGTLNRKKGEVQMVGFFADYIEDELAGAPVFEPVMEFVAQILLHPLTKDNAFDERIVAGEMRNIRNAMDARINDKRVYAASQMIRTMFEDEAYSVPRLGDPEDLEKLNAEKLYAHYREILAHSQVELFYMGRKSPNDVAQTLRRVLADLPRGETVSVGTGVRRKADRVKEVTKSMDVTQGKLCMGLRTGCNVHDAEYPALLVLNAVFGAGATSKLFLNVREQMSLCYYAGSSIDKYKGIMIISSGIEFDMYETVRREILNQLDECRMGHITQD
ncbi:MAG: insulinase family protein, partial [Oscillospiraceae bacterium]|nr:insulinase family protein [Oscillospiraceae bacterium]